MIEATVIVMDNSDYARNGDLFPSRWEAQLEAAQLLANAKLETNMESGVGMIVSGGKQVQLLMTPTNDQNQLIATCEKMRLGGCFFQENQKDQKIGLIQFSKALNIAQLTLKHRINKKQNQRITVFVASPVEEEEAVLVSLAKKLKKNNIAVDIFNFGEQRDDHLNKLEVFVNTVKKGNNSIFLNIRPGAGSVFDYVATAISNQASDQQQPQGEAQAGGQAPVVPGNNFSEFGGIDPTLDPELAMAMKLSLEEEQAKQKNQPQTQAQPQQQGMQEETPQQHQPLNEPQQQPQQQPQQFQKIEEEGLDDEELLRRAQELSLEEEQLQKQAQQANENQDMFEDKDFVEDLLKSADVDMNSEEIQKLLKRGGDPDEKNQKK